MAKVEVGSTQWNFVVYLEMAIHILSYGVGAGVGVFAILSLVPFGPLGETILTAVLVSIFAGIFGGSRAFARNIKADAAKEEAAKAVQKALEQEERNRPLTVEEKTARRETFTGIKLGYSTGKFLNERGHSGGIPADQEVSLSAEDCAKNMITFGGIGSGKTTRFINPVLMQIMEQDAGALIFDIKTDFQQEVAAITKHAGRTYKIVGDGGMTLNLFRGLTPELAASFMKSCFLAQGTGDTAMWADLATEHCRHCLTLMKLTEADYSIANLYDVASSDSIRNELIAKVEAAFSDMSERDQRLTKATMRYFSDWMTYDSKQRSSIMLNINAVLPPFSHPDLIDAFSSESEHGEADLTELINDGAVYLVNIPQTKYGKEGARYAYLLTKLRFFHMMRERRGKADWNQTRPVAFICDEYQSIIDSISDTDFWDKSRSSKTIGIVSMQGMASLIQALQNNEKAAEAILQNFRQRMFFRTEDEATLRHIQHLLGQVDVTLESTGAGYNSSESVSTPNGAGGQGSKSTSESYSENTGASLTRQDLFGPNDMRALTADYALFIGNMGDRAADDVLNVQPLYVN